MGCKFACICSGNCLRCSSFEEESYCGEAEDFFLDENGYCIEEEEREV